MTLQQVTDDLAAKAQAKPGVTHSIGLARGLRLALRFRRGRYVLSMGRVGVYPSVGEKAILRRCFCVPVELKWKTARREQWHVWYIEWDPDKCDGGGVRDLSKQLPIAWPAGVGPAAAVARYRGGPT